MHTFKRNSLPVIGYTSSLTPVSATDLILLADKECTAWEKDLDNLLHLYIIYVHFILI